MTSIAGHKLNLLLKHSRNVVTSALSHGRNASAQYSIEEPPRKEASIICGKTLSKEIRNEVRADIAEWVTNGNRHPALAVVLVGEDPASATYVKNKIKACKDVGIRSESIQKSPDISQDELLDIIANINNDDNIDGLLVQLPLPEHIDERLICNAVAPNKDVDGFHVTNIGRLSLDIPTMLPATPSGIWEMLQRSGIDTFAKTAVVCGRSKNVGMPISMLLHTDHRHERPGGDATVTITHRYTPKENLKMFSKTADILIAAAGIPHLITADMVKKGACVIDVGINRIKDPESGKYKLVGDVDFEGVKKVAGHITPVPGGVGPMTVAMLCKNTLTAARKEISY